MPAILNFRAPRWWRGRGRSLNIFASPLRWRHTRGGGSLLLAWCRTLEIPLPGTSLFRRALFFPLRLFLPGRRSWHGLLLIALPHYRVTRLVTVFLLMQLLLLLHLPGIPIF